jgi:hypothetical protein
MQAGESAGFAAALALKNGTTPGALNPDLLRRKLATSHVMISFFNDADVTADDAWIPAAQYFGTKGFFADYDARPAERLKKETARLWGEALTKMRTPGFDAEALARAVAQAESNAGESISASAFAALLPKSKTAKTAEGDAPITRAAALQILFSLLP